MIEVAAGMPAFRNAERLRYGNLRLPGKALTGKCLFTDFGVPPSLFHRLALKANWMVRINGAGALLPHTNLKAQKYAISASLTEIVGRSWTGSRRSGLDHIFFKCQFCQPVFFN